MMIGERDAEIANRIGSVLLDIIPDDADKITASSQVAEDWAETKIRFEDSSGNVGHFSLKNAPKKAIGDINEAVMELREAMAEGGGAAWNRSVFTAHRDGQFNVEFSYEEGDEL
jgi:hypothetical protein